MCSMNGHKTLNLVVPRYSILPFDLADIPSEWREYYPNLSKQTTITAINEILPSLGYVFLVVNNKQGIQYHGLGTAFQLSSSIIATSLHIIQGNEEIVVEDSSTQLYFTTHPDIGGNTFRKLVKSNMATMIAESYEQDVVPYNGVMKLFDPMLKKDREISTLPDFCLLRLATPLPQQKYFIPHPRVNVERTEVYVLGIPGESSDQPINISEKDFSLSQLNVHVSGGLKQHISPGHIIHTKRPIEDNKVIAHDCYTHEGNSGSPLVIHHSPDLVLGIHQQWSLFPHAGIATTTSSIPFVTSYMSRVIPEVLKGGFHIDQCISIQLYLDSFAKNIKQNSELKVLKKAFNDKYAVMIEERYVELGEINFAAKRARKEKQMNEKMDTYNLEWIVSGLTEREYKKRLDEKKAAKVAKNNMKMQEAAKKKNEKVKARAEKRKRIDNDEYECVNEREYIAIINEKDGKDFLQVNHLIVDDTNT